MILFYQLYLETFSQITFQKIYGGEGGYSVVETFDNGFITVGTIKDIESSHYDVYLIRTDQTGDTLWTRSYGGEGSEFGQSVMQTVDSGFIVTGYTNSFGAGGNDVYLIRTNKYGDLEWSRTYGGGSIDIGYWIEKTIDNNFIIIGHTANYGAGINDIYLIKIDSLGDLQWTKTYGASYNDYGYCVKQMADSGFIILGKTWSFDQNTLLSLLIKTDGEGNITWSKTFEGRNSSSIEITDDGCVILAGNIVNPVSGFQNLFLSKIDMNGNIIWAKTYDNNYSDYKLASPNDVQQTSDGGLITTCSYGYEICLMKTDDLGSIEWGKTYGEGGRCNDNAYSTYQTDDNGFIITGRTQSNSIGYDDLFLFKTDSLGNSGCTDISLNINSMSFSPIITNRYLQTSEGGVVGNPLTIVNKPSSSIQELGSPIADFTYKNDSALTVTFTDASTNALNWYWVFGDGTNDTLQWWFFHTYPDSANYEVCLTVTNNCGSDTHCKTINVPSSISGILETQNNYLLKTYPNPFIDYLIVEYKNRENTVNSLTLYNSKGQIVQNINNIQTEVIRIERNNLTNGIYFLILRSGDRIIGNKKIIVK